MVNRLCDPIIRIFFQSILTNVEHISDKCSDLAVYVLEGENSAIFGNEHSYVHELHHSNNAAYLQDYEDGRTKYFAELDSIPVTNIIEEAVIEAGQDETSQ